MSTYGIGFASDSNTYVLDVYDLPMQLMTAILTVYLYLTATYMLKSIVMKGFDALFYTFFYRNIRMDLSI